MQTAAETKQSNRRLAPRRKPRSYVKLECRQGSMGLGKNLAITLLDLSETGARLIIRQELPAKQEVEVVLAGMNQTVKMLANVRWQVKLHDGNFCIGVAFQKRIPYREWMGLATPS
jgi:hypothetical protein